MHDEGNYRVVVMQVRLAVLDVARLDSRVQVPVPVQLQGGLEVELKVLEYQLNPRRALRDHA